MKKIFYLLLLTFAMVQCTPKTAENTTSGNTDGIKISASPDTQLDRSKPPVPKPAPKIQMGDYQEFTLENGLKCIVVKNDKLPRVSFQYTLNIDPIMEKDQAGMQAIVGEMLGRGTKNRTKQQLDEEVDFMGATLSTYADGVYASSLSQHTDKIIELMADVLLNPTFPEEELEKVRTQTLSGLASNKNEPNAISDNVANVLRYGKSHPYGELETEETVKSITREHLTDFYFNNFNPNKGYLVIVGDIDAAAAQKKMQEYFKQWKQGEVTKRTYETPRAPQETTVSMVDRAGSVQSVITVTYPIDLKPGSDDVIAASVANSILGGGGFSGRLMQNLREDKGYTYGAGSSLSYDPLVGEFSASASVRNEVTDSAVAEILYEIAQFSKEKVKPEDLQKTKNIMAGNFARSLERPQTVANFALNIARYNLPADYYEKYLERLAAVTADDVMRVAQKYLTAQNAHVLVVGDKSEVGEKLARFDFEKKVKYYDNYGNPVKVSETPVSVTAVQVVENYLKAIGGTAATAKIADVVGTYELETMGQRLNVVISQKTPNKFKLSMQMAGQEIQTQIFDGKNAVSAGMGGTKKMEGKELERFAESAVLFPEAIYGSYTVVMNGIENINGTEAYKLSVTSPSGEKATNYYAVASGLKIRSITTQESPQGSFSQITDYSDYKTVEGVQFPHLLTQTIGAQSVKMTVKSLVVNSGIDDAVFKVE